MAALLFTFTQKVLCDEGNALFQISLQNRHVFGESFIDGSEKRIDVLFLGHKRAGAHTASHGLIRLLNGAGRPQNDRR